MIESISISNVATFGITPVQVNALSQVNFFFGSNGTGKTTVSRVIVDETKFPTNKDRSCAATILSGGWTSPFRY
jgi:predicted ATPase